jgi:hypothetical protein
MIASAFPCYRLLRLLASTPGAYQFSGLCGSSATNSDP